MHFLRALWRCIQRPSSGIPHCNTRVPFARSFFFEEGPNSFSLEPTATAVPAYRRPSPLAPGYTTPRIRSLLDGNVELFLNLDRWDNEGTSITGSRIQPAPQLLLGHLLHAQA